MNDFCLYCTGNDKREIAKCRDKKCPFYRDKWANLDWQNDKRRKTNLNIIFQLISKSRTNTLKKEKNV